MTSAELMELTVRALTFFNVVALTWLGLTVLFNADRGKPGTWLTAAGLLIGSVCSVGHGVVAGPAGWTRPGSPIDWWRLTWLPFAGAPYLWSIVVVWYAGRLRSRAGSAGRPCAHPGGAGGLRPPAGAPGPRRPASRPTGSGRGRVPALRRHLCRGGARSRCIARVGPTASWASLPPAAPSPG